jgi:putative MFS transporter
MLFESYDQAMLTVALKQVAESFGVAESDLGGLLGLVHLGAVAAFLLLPLADRFGRRRLFLGSLIGLSLATCLTAFAQGVAQYVVLQMLARAFMVTCAATALVILAEELPADRRAFGIGIAGAVGAAGHGLGILLFAAIDVLPQGWRALYLLGLLPLLLLPRLRREVQETRRFSRERASAATRTAQPNALLRWWLPLRELVLWHPGRSLAVAALGALSAAGHSAAFNLSAYHVQTSHGWLPWQFTAMALAGGAVGIVGHPAAGLLADAFGRRRVGFALLAGFPLLALAFYRGPGWLLPLAWIPLVFTLTGGETLARVLAAELFPTSSRGTASGWLQLSAALGRALGLFAVAGLTPDGGSNVPALSLVVCAPLLAGLVVLFLPETGARELEEIAPRR